MSNLDKFTNYICLCLGAPMYNENNEKIAGA